MTSEPAQRARRKPNKQEAPRPRAWDAAHTAKAAAAVIAVIALAAGLWYAQTAVLLAFAGILLAIVFYGASRALAELTGLPRLLMLAAVVLSVGLFFALLFLSVGPSFADQLADLAARIARGAQSLAARVVRYADQTELLKNIDLVEVVSGFLSPWGVATGATTFALSIVGVLSAGLIVLFFGVYLAADPHTYVEIAARFAPKGRRTQTIEMLYETGDLLRRWLIGQGIAMALIGTMTYVGLLFLGVPNPFALALFAGLAGFLPVSRADHRRGADDPRCRRREPDARGLGARALRHHPVRRELSAHAADPVARSIAAAGHRHSQPARVRRRVRIPRSGACDPADRRGDSAHPPLVRNREGRVCSPRKSTTCREVR